ncbi:hypothetical protein, conserved, partial [Eimeria tenella]
MGYRNKCEFTVGVARRQQQQEQQQQQQQQQQQEEEQESPCVGFVCGVQRLQPQVAPPSGLLLLNHGMQEAAHAMEQLLRQSPFPVYNRRTHKGTWRLLMVRTSAWAESMMLVVQINPFQQQQQQQQDQQQQQQQDQQQQQQQQQQDQQQQQQQQQQREAAENRKALIQSVVDAFAGRTFGMYKVTSIFLQE